MLSADAVQGTQSAKVEGSKDDIFGEDVGKKRKKTEEGWNIYTEVRGLRLLLQQTQNRFAGCRRSFYACSQGSAQYGEAVQSKAPARRQGWC